MARLGITPKTAAPEGGEIIRDASGAPTGIFVDTAKRLVTPQERGEAEQRRAIELAMDECLCEGRSRAWWTPAQSVEAIALYKELAAAGKLRTRLYVMASGLGRCGRSAAPRRASAADGSTSARSSSTPTARSARAGRRCSSRTPTTPATAACCVTPPEEILEAARFALAHGFQVGTHAIGDRANRMVLDAYEKAFGERPEVKDPRFRIEHAQILDAADIPRFGRARA